MRIFSAAFGAFLLNAVAHTRVGLVNARRLGEACVLEKYKLTLRNWVIKA